MAYRPEETIDSFDMNLNNPEFGGKVLGESTDLFADEQGSVYITDAGNNRVVILDKYLRATGVIESYVDEFNKTQTFSKPKGLYVSNPELTANPEDTGMIYVCDTGNKRIVVFNRDVLDPVTGNYKYERTIECPETPLLKLDNFVPSAIAVDLYGRIFIISESSFEGVIVLSSEGEFTGYIGAQKVTYSLLDMIWRRFQTDEQKEAAIKNISYAYNNITVDEDGFVYVTSDKVDEAKQYASIKSKNPDYSPVKKLNSTGIEIMQRNGFFDPGGEVDVFYAKEVSKINDVALGPEGSWTILDYSRSKFFTYDQTGNLLFAFGDSGEQLGNGESLKAMCYQHIDGIYYLLALDQTKSGYKINVYSPTSYCDTLMTALHNQNAYNYSAAIEDWEQVLKLNNNFDLAYIGIGKALFNQGKYDEAYEILQNAYETKYASDAFSENRKQIINSWVGAVVIVLLIALIVAFVWFLGFAKKKNKATSLKVGRKTYWEELLFAFHLVFHPFDGFWDLKHEKRGSVRAATTILALTVAAFAYNTVGKGYLFDPKGNTQNALMAVISVILPVILFAISNWCLTTLFDGEGSFKDIYIAVCYSLAPLPLFLIISTILTNVMTQGEGGMVNLLVTFAFIWTVILLFFGVLVTHDYSIGKNIATILGTILAMAIIIFVIVLFSSLVVKMISFVMSLITEIGNRI
ncbi:MAG: YIP1 family protein [Clostridia bacterium]|nr:YIP1 family protein [Clostridia bacterium]